jgi:hypothetical protein
VKGVRCPRPFTSVRLSEKWFRRGVVSFLVVSLSLIFVQASGAIDGHAASTAMSSDSDQSTLLAKMHPLDFLLGKWVCSLTYTLPGEPVVHSAEYHTTKPILDGTWYEWDAIDPPSILFPSTWHGSSIFGWNEITSEFDNTYYDSHGGIGSETSTGWKDGHLKFVGPYYFPGEYLTVVPYLNDYTTSSSNKFTLVTSLGEKGKWIPLLKAQCKRA